MIAFEVTVNGKRVCIAGADDLAVLTASVTALGKLGKKTIPARPDEVDGKIHYSIGGLTGRRDPKRDIHMRWKSVVPLQVGDVVQVKVICSNRADRPRSRTRALK